MKPLALLPLLALLACRQQADLPVPALPAPAAAAGTALYRVTFEATWSAATHASFPAGGHFSPLVGLSHQVGSTLFEEGQLASLGIKNVAELGNNTAIRAEIAARQGSGTALGLLGNNGSSFASPGTRSDTVRLDAAHPLLTVVTMIAPSPDWFAALENKNLLENGQWVTQRTVPAHAYDAGTDSGPTFTAPDQPTTPAQPIQKLLLPSATGLAPDGPSVGTWRLERLR
jgi:hypothetical protein